MQLLDPSSTSAAAWPHKQGTCALQVNVGEDEPEDIAVRKFMKKVVESRVIEQVWFGLCMVLHGLISGCR